MVGQEAGHVKAEWMQSGIERWTPLGTSTPLGDAEHTAAFSSGLSYLDESEWRFNNRDNPWLFRDTLTKLLQSSNLEYKELIAPN